MKTVSASCLVFWLLTFGTRSIAQQSESLADFIRPLVGTQGDGNTFPGPSAPFGMVQFSPDTDPLACAGYKYSHTSILGFSLTHLTGTGVQDLGDFLFTPMVGEPKFVPGTKEKPESGYRSRYSHTNESASAAYYSVKLEPSGITAELTAATRAGLMRFTFPATERASILTDLDHLLYPDWDRSWCVVWSHLRQENDNTITGYHLVHGWAKERPLYFAARYSRPFDHSRILSHGNPLARKHEASGTALQFLAEYDTRSNQIILIKAAVSAISAENALKNLDAEIPDWDFEKVCAATREQWEHELAKVRIEGTREEKETFYTSMYHTLLAPNLYEDVTGEYRGLDHNTHLAKNFKNYTVFSLWDTYRATHPLFALIESDRDADMINSMLAHYDQSVEHMLPVWPLQANETWCMIGYHAVPVIVDGYLKGVKGFDPARAYKAIKTTALNPDYSGLATYANLGWVPCDKFGESVSKTLEYAYDDYCVAQMAKALGKQQDYQYFLRRSQSFTNLFDPSAGLMRPKDSQGQWRTPFDPHHWTMGDGGDYTEADSWQYSWYVPQDVPALMNLMGGPERFCQQLDALFDYQGGATKKNLAQGKIGDYWHGNEPGHHTIYLYCYAGQPWKAAERLHQVVNSQYGNRPNSLCGNDDCGQMSAWHIFTALGFYPVCPGSDQYVLGSPDVSKAVIRLSNGKTFTVTAQDLSATNIYVQSVRLNGKEWNTPFLPHSELARGGTLAFVMGVQPSRWATKATPPTSM